MRNTSIYGAQGARMYGTREVYGAPEGAPGAPEGAPGPRIVRPPGRWPTLRLQELLHYRHLLWVFVKRGILTRYRQMALGVLWSFLEPLGLLLVMSIVFGLLIRVPTGQYPYPVFVFAALIPWFYFSKATNAAAISLQEYIGIISKLYFPRVILPLAAAVREFFDSIVLFVLLVLLAWFYGFPPTPRLVLMPLLLVYITLPALGLGLAVASISIKYRDFRPLLVIVLQVGFYATPIFYPGELVPPIIRPIYQLNPLYWGVEISRWIMLGKPVEITPSFYLSLLVSATAVVLGYLIFAIYERIVVDAQ
jgi:lipopolysaccharide transport system permease protein